MAAEKHGPLEPAGRGPRRFKPMRAPADIGAFPRQGHTRLGGTLTCASTAMPGLDAIGALAASGGGLFPFLKGGQTDGPSADRDQLDLGASTATGALSHDR